MAKCPKCGGNVSEPRELIDGGKRYVCYNCGDRAFNVRADEVQPRAAEVEADENGTVTSIRFVWVDNE